jgi:hypothetical protein
MRYQLKIYKIPIEINTSFGFWKFWNGVVQSFCFGLNTSPHLALIAKNRERESLLYFLPLGKRNMSEELYQLRVTWVMAKGKWYRQSWSGSLVFAEYSIPFQFKTKHGGTLENTLVLILVQEE